MLPLSFFVNRTCTDATADWLSVADAVSVIEVGAPQAVESCTKSVDRVVVPITGGVESTGVGVGDGSGVGPGVAPFVGVGAVVGVPLGVPFGVAVGVPLGVAVGVAAGVGAAVGASVGVTVAWTGRRVGGGEGL